MKVAAMLIVVIGVTGRAPAQAQTWAAGAEPMLMDTAGFGDGPYARMSTLLEKTIFKADVLTLEVRFSADEAARIEGYARGRRYSAALADSIAAVAIGAHDVYARLRFVRNVSLEQFVDGVREDLRRTPAAGIISQADYERISSNLPVWFAFLAERRILDGDELHYRIHGDTLHTQYRGVGGEILLDQVDVDPAAPRSVLGSYFVRGSSFRGGLIRSLFPTGR